MPSAGGSAPSAGGAGVTGSSWEADCLLRLLMSSSAVESGGVLERKACGRRGLELLVAGVGRGGDWVARIGGVGEVLGNLVA
jgi:hypothetical protein